MAEPITDAMIEAGVAAWIEWKDLSGEKALVRAILTAALAVGAERDWRPISEAPKDGTLLLVFHGGMVGVARWSEKFAPVFGDTSPGWYSDILDRRVQPTHWQPLPSPPSEQEG